MNFPTDEQLIMGIPNWVRGHQGWVAFIGILLVLVAVVGLITWGIYSSGVGQVQQIPTPDIWDGFLPYIDSGGR